MEEFIQDFGAKTNSIGIFELNVWIPTFNSTKVSFMKKGIVHMNSAQMAESDCEPHRIRYWIHALGYRQLSGKV